MSTRTRIFGLMLLGILLGLSTLGVPVAHAAPKATCTVTTNVDDNTTANSLRVLIANPSCATINFNADYTINLSGVLGQLIISRDVVIDGTGHAIVINGGGCANCRVFTITSGGTNVTLNQLTLSNGKETTNGAGIQIQTGATVTFYNSTVSGNTASGANGGGIYNSGKLTMTNSTITNNSAFDGGGIANPGGTLTVTNSTIANNSASGYGGGIYNEHNTLIVTNSTITNNSAQKGGGIYNIDAALTVTNSTIANNKGTDRGGGIRNNSGTLTVTNSIIASNTTDFSIGPNCDSTNSTTTDNGGNIDSGTSCGFGASSKSSTDPKLSALADNGGPTQTMALTSNSPAIDYATANCPAGDQRGYVRSSPKCDSGAFEYGAKLATSITLTSSLNPSTAGQSVTFTATVTSTVGTPSGTVNFKADGTSMSGCGAKALSSGTATCATSALTVGTRTITAEYSGDTNYNTSTGTLTGGQVVNLGNTTVNLTLSPGPYIAGQSLTLTATVTETQTSSGASAGKTTARAPRTVDGTVTFKDSGVNIPGCINVAVNGSGVATCAVTLSQGAHSFSATYNGGGTTNGSSVNAPINVTANGLAAQTPREVPEGDTLLLLGGGLSGVGVWLRWQWRKRKRG